MVDDEPPATVILSARPRDGVLEISGLSHDNGDIVAVTVNGRRANIASAQAGVVDWHIEIDPPADGVVEAAAQDADGNAEVTGHRLALSRH